MFKDDYKAVFSKVNASDETYRRVMYMTKETKKHSATGVLTKILVAAALVSMLTLTASAAARNWFLGYFADESETPLSTEQVEFIEENVQDINQSQTCNGYTIEVKSVLSDGQNAYILFGITAPEGVCLDRTVKEGYSTAAPVLWTNASFVTEEKRGYGATWNMQDDGDGLANTHNLVYLISSDSAVFEKGTTCEIRFEDLTAEYTNDAYAAELEEKYGYVPKLGELSEEESEKLYPCETLAEGEWNFTITFEKSDTQVVELIDKPVDYVLEYQIPGETVTKMTKVLSVKLSPIGAVCTFEAGENAPDSIGGDIYLKDGSSISLSGDTVGGSSDSASWGMFSVPIALENVDYVQFPDGTKLPMPELKTE